MRKVKIDTLVTIKNYAAGQNGAMLVALDENLSIEGMYGKKGDKKINLLICTAMVDKADAEALVQYVDDVTPTSRVILVSKKFLRLRNTTQLALLEIQNSAMQVVTPETSETRRLYGEYCAIERFGKIEVAIARRKEQTVKNKSLNKATRGVHQAHVKELRKERTTVGGSLFDIFKLLGAKESFLDPIDLDEIIEDDELATPEPAITN